jgi:hypothetical protein
VSLLEDIQTAGVIVGLKPKRRSNMLSVRIQLHRPYDREPGDHLYGEPFDSAVDLLVGGVDRWSSPRRMQQGNPLAVIPGAEISIELHEDGPVFEFFLKNIEHIPNYINALAAVVSAWIAARALRVQQLPKDDFSTKEGTLIRIGDLRIESARRLSAAELQRLVSAIATTSSDRMSTEDAKSELVGSVPFGGAGNGHRLEGGAERRG